MMMLLEHSDLVQLQLFLVVALGLSTGFAGIWVRYDASR